MTAEGVALGPDRDADRWTSRFDRPLGRVGLAAVGLVLIGLAVYGWFIPYAGPWPVEAPTGLDVAFASIGGLLWGATTLMALSATRTARFGWLLVAFSFAELWWTIGFIQVDALYFLAGALRGFGSVVLAHVLVSFPTGRLADRFDRAVVALVYVFAIGTSIVELLVWDPIYTCEIWCPRNPFALLPNQAVEEVVSTATPLLIPVIAAPVLWSIARHWRRAGPAGRRVLFPVLAAVPFQYAVNATGFMAQRFDIRPILDLLETPPVRLTAIILPAAFLIGILRARLNRGRLAELAVTLGRGVPIGRLRDVLAATIGDPTLQLAFAGPDGTGFVDPDGHPIELASDGSRATQTVVRDGTTVAILIHDPAILDEDPELIRAVGSVAGLALENERLSAQVRAQLEEVRASRQRIVEAGDAERRRVERDLHDGAQQRLVALAMRLDAARGTTTEARTLIDDATAELGVAISEVRQLARGLHPTILTEAGLRAAIDALAERTPIPVEVIAGSGRYPASVEAAAYFVIAEALTNVARYSGATYAAVSLHSDGGRLRVEIRDDGRGGADPAAGSGLRGLADRVAAIGGTLDVRSAAGTGTTVLASLPLETYA